MFDILEMNVKFQKLNYRQQNLDGDYSRGLAMIMFKKFMLIYCLKRRFHFEMSISVKFREKLNVFKYEQS